MRNHSLIGANRSSRRIAPFQPVFRTILTLKEILSTEIDLIQTEMSNLETSQIPQCRLTHHKLLTGNELY